MTALKYSLSSRVLKWMGHTIATIFLPRSYCQDIFRIPQGGVLSFKRTVHWCIEYATPSLSRSERCQTSFLQHCGGRIHRIWTQSTIASGVYYRRKFSDTTIANVSEFDNLSVWSTRGDALSSRSWILLSASGVIVAALMSVKRGKLWAPNIKFQLFCHVSTKSY